MAADVTLLFAADLLAYQLRFEILASAIPPKEQVFGFATHAIPLVSVPIMFLVMVWADLYRPRREQRFYQEAGAIIRASLVGLAILIAFLSLFRNVLFDGRHYSGWQFALYGSVTISLLLVWRLTFRTILRVARRRGWNQRHVAIIGTGRLGQVACKTLLRNTWTGIKPAYFISHTDRPQERCMGLPVLGELGTIDQILDEHPVSGVIIALPGKQVTRLADLIPRLERFPVDVRIVPDTNPRYMPINMTVHELDGMPVLSVRESPLSTGWGPIAKRAVDVLGSLAGLLIFALPMLVIALLIRRSSPGPVIFRQERMSLNGQRFKIFKFRTMGDVDVEVQTLRDAGRGTEAWTKPDDPRITRIGRLLRRTSLDELPQLLNVLLGEMSLVGPRPERPELIEKFRDDWRGYMLRQNVKAGMTGWAQVNGLRGQTSLRKRVQYDLFYIRHWSLAFDLRILWMTLYKGFAHPNAS
jgi:Undecaprenyl-phosphate glucose phosphotransferase